MLLGIHLTLLIGPTVPMPASAELIDAIKSIKVTNTDESRDGFEITFAVGRSGPQDLLDYPILNNIALKPNCRLIIQVFFGLTPHVLIDGIIKLQQLNPSIEPGKSTLTITGEDISVVMDKEEKSVPHPNMPDNITITKIISEYVTYGMVPKVQPPLLAEVTTEIDRIPTQRSTDLKYLQTLARTHNCVFYIEPTDVPTVTTAYWGPLNIIGIPQKALSFNIGGETNVITLNSQNNSLSPTMVKGYVTDRITGQKFPILSLPPTRPPLATQPAWLVNQPNVNVKQFTGDGGVSALQAQSQAQAEADGTIDVITVTGELDAMKYGNILRARKLVGLRGVGISYGGLYYVKNVTHNIKRGEYKQSFTLTREGLVSTVPLV